MWRKGLVVGSVLIILLQKLGYLYPVQKVVWQSLCEVTYVSLTVLDNKMMSAAFLNAKLSLINERFETSNMSKPTHLILKCNKNFENRSSGSDLENLGIFEKWRI